MDSWIEEQTELSLDTIALATGLAGGIGLFLLGMRLLTDGLRVAAGRALQRLLSRWTSTRLRGILSGALITAIVQSSSAVTVATIGFVNAGILNLSQSIAVIFGSNVGTTMTAWIVALVGFHVDMQAFALPAIGLGMALRISGGNSRRGAFGEALAGFGIFFLGIDVLKSAFGDLGETIQVAPYVREGFANSFIFVGIGFVMTLLMQSSSAAIAVTLTGAAGNVLPLGVAASIIIGTNLGTTSTALLAAVGATPNAKRVAAAHVIFNAVTGLVALGILPVILYGVLFVRRAVSLDDAPATILALFHTSFNVLGVLLLWPFSDRMALFLERRFRTVEEDEAQPHFLDRNIVRQPVLALRALHRELQRIGSIALRSARSRMSGEPGATDAGGADRETVRRLFDAVGDFALLLQQARMPSDSAELLEEALRVGRNYSEVADLSEQIAQASARGKSLEDFSVAAALARFKAAVVGVIDAAEPGGGSEADLNGRAVEATYDDLKTMLIRSATEGRLPVRELAAHLDAISLMRRMTRHAVEAGARLHALEHAAGDTDTAPATEAPNQE